MIGFLIILALNYGCNLLSGLLHLPLPGTIIALVVFFILLATKVLKVSTIEAAADFLLANMIVMFVPPTIKIIDHFHLIQADLLKIILLLVGSTILTLLATAGAVQLTLFLLNKRKNRLALKRNEVKEVNDGNDA